MKQILTLLVFILFACNNSKNCEKYYNNYVDLRIQLKNNQAIIALNEAIQCDKINEDYLFEKVNYLIELNDLLQAKNTLVDLQKINDSFTEHFPLYGVLELKSGNEIGGHQQLTKVFENLSKLEYDESNFNLFYYKLLVQLYVKGKKHVSKDIENQTLYNGSNEKEIMNYLIDLINSENDSIDILYKAFKIEKDI